ncbi:MAG: fumarylacetoacetate hydrolase family protein [Lentisphaeraceae bacterium]|nr:fumarylacetoacetate hydrolase family protein [Lentisphaeraceae bacterium]
MKIFKALKLKKSVIAAQSLALAFLVSSCASQKQEIVQQVITAQETNGYMLPPSIQGFKLESLNEAYEVQDLYNERKSTTHGPVSGYKIAYASKQSQKVNGISEPVYGALFKKQFVPSGGSIKIDDFSGFHIETEIAFIIDKQIPNTVDTIEQLKPYIRSVHIGYDIPDNIYDSSQGKFCPNDIVIFGAAAHTYSYGAAFQLKDIHFNGNKLDVFHADKKVYEGNENNTMGSPFESLLWLTRKLRSQNKKLEAGHVVLCGAVGSAYKAKGVSGKGTYSGKHPVLGQVIIEVK